MREGRWRVGEGSKTKSGVPGSGAPGCRTRLNVQSGHCKLKLNALVSKQCLLTVVFKRKHWEAERLIIFSWKSLGRRRSAERDPAWSCTLERGRLEGSK